MNPFVPGVVATVAQRLAEARRLGACEGAVWLAQVRAGVARAEAEGAHGTHEGRERAEAERAHGTHGRHGNFDPMKTTNEAGQAAGIMPRVIVAELGGEVRPALLRAERQMDYGVHWLWRNHAQIYTAAGVLLVAELFDAESHAVGAAVCRRLAARMQAEDRARTEVVAVAAAKPAGVAAATAGEDEFLAKRWDLRGERGEGAS